MSRSENAITGSDDVQFSSTVDVGAGVLEGLVDETISREKESIPISSGRLLEIERTDNGDRLSICSPDDVVELEILITDTGPLLRFRSADLQLQAIGSVKVECEDYSVKATRSILHETEGHLLLKAKEELDMEGKVSTLCATRGDVKIKANDDVRLNGERIRLNC